MKISFLDFWNGFQPTNNFLFYLFREVHQNLTIVEPSKAELIVFSVFGNENQKYSHCRKLFFTGENKRPDFKKCDFSISFDFDDYNGRNIRIPLWYYYIDWFKVGSYGDPNYLIPVEYLYDSNEFSEKEKNKFCSAVYSNPVGIRNQFVNLLSQYKRVDCYGKIGGFTRLPDGEKQKLDTISNYKFNICFENSIYPGYYTEKLLHAKVAGCVPIYYSDSRIFEDFNDDCLINLNNFQNFQDLFDKIIELDNDDLLYRDIFNRPLFNNKIDLELIIKKLGDIK
jgi:hypothetical protein